MKLQRFSKSPQYSWKGLDLICLNKRLIFHVEKSSSDAPTRHLVATYTTIQDFQLLCSINLSFRYIRNKLLLRKRVFAGTTMQRPNTVDCPAFLNRTNLKNAKKLKISFRGPNSEDMQGRQTFYSLFNIKHVNF